VIEVTITMYLIKVKNMLSQHTKEVLEWHYL
jgi:hypothetical protein